MWKLRSRSRGLCALLLVLLMALALASCGGPPPEQAVRAQIAAMQAAIDARDAGKVSDLLAEDFVGNDGLDKRGARRMAAGIFLQYRNVTGRIGPVSVELRGDDDAIARFTVLATAGSGGLVPQDGQVFEVETGWHRDGSDWLLRSASWKPKL